MTHEWQTKRLGEVSRRITDGSHNPPKGISFSNYLMLSSKNIFDDSINYNNPRFLSAELFLQEDKRTRIEAGDVLLTIVGTIGRTAVVPSDAPKITLQRSVAVIRLNSDIIHSRFLMYSFISRNAELNEQARGVAQKGIYLETLRELEIRYPILPEQQRIVGILDDAFDSIATAKANAEKNLQNARALFESHLQAVFTQRGEGIIEKRLDDVCVLFDCLHKTPTYVENGFPMVRVTDIKPGFLDLSKTRKVDEKTFIEFSKKHTPKTGDIVFSRVGSYGVSSLVNSDEPFCLGQNTVLVVPKINSRLLYYFLNSPVAKTQFDELVDGTTQPTISLKSIREVKLALPLRDNEELIVKLDRLSSETQRLESIYRRKLAAFDELKKSLLHQAFNGEL